MPARPRRTATPRGTPPLDAPEPDALPAGPDPSDVVGVAEELERSMRPLVDAALGAAEELEERVAPVHLRALQALEGLGPSHVSALAEAMSLLPSTVSRLSDRLTAAGLITRDVSPVNRRATMLGLTPSGRAVLADLARARTDRVGMVLAAMAETEREALLHGMHAFAAAAEGLPPEETGAASGA